MNLKSQGAIGTSLALENTNVFGLRQKLAIGFGGLLAILLFVSGLSITRMNAYSRTLETIFRENYDSISYCLAMREALDGLDDAAQPSLIEGIAPSPVPAADDEQRFQLNLDRERNNITLPGERELAESIPGLWYRYRALHRQVTTPATPSPQRLAIYRDSLSPLGQQINAAAQKIVDLNLQNMVNTDGQVRRTAVGAKRAMYALTATGIAMAVIFVALIGRNMLQPLRALTKSAREIERGNLDLVVKVRSRDEVGQLAEAFNAMATKLREFRRTDQAKLARTERTTQLAVNSLPEAVAIIDTEGRIELANQTARTFFSLEPGVHVSTLPLKALADLYHRVARDILPLESPGYEAAIQVFDTGGVERFFLPQAVPILDENRTLLGVTLLLADVTNLRRIDEMKSGMLSVVSHELKTPLTSIRMAVHLLLEERVGALTPKQTEMLVAARDDSDRLHKIIENLLDLGRMRGGQALMNLAPASPEQMANAAIEPFRGAFHDKGVKLSLDLPAELPEALVDADRLDHVFGNFLSNALKYTPAGGEVAVSATALGGERDADGFVQFSVVNSGQGIPKEHLPRLFDRFYRVPNQEGVQGVGLGLAIAKDIVEAHGGRIWAESEAGEPTRFSFTVRQHNPADEAHRSTSVANSQVKS